MLPRPHIATFQKFAQLRAKVVMRTWDEPFLLTEELVQRWRNNGSMERHRPLTP